MRQWNPDSCFTLLVVGVVVWLIHRRQRWTPSSSAHGTARWATDADLRRRVGRGGLAIGRSLAGRAHYLSVESVCIRLVAQ